MKLDLKPVCVHEKEILRNLLEKYDYEFSQWDLRDVNPLGLFGYDYLDCYFTDKNRYAFFIMADGHLAGFVMVNDYPESKEPTDFSVAEFFVMLKYRRKGVGKFAAFQVFNQFHGKWQLRRHPHNLPSVAFWDKIISAYTDGNYRLSASDPDAAYDDGTLGDIFFFDNTGMPNKSSV